MPKIRKQFETADDIETAFYDALGRADLDALMALWADDDDIVCVHPGGGRLIGHGSIRKAWEQIFEQGGVHIRPTQLHVAQNVMTSVHNVIENVHRPGDAPQDMHVLATNVYMKTPRGWRMVMHHVSVAPGEAPTETPLTNLLH
jgi:ketosteroid isomerase-like protein